mgnify:CR=1 FL=1
MMNCHLCNSDSANIQIQIHNHLLQADQTIQLCQSCADARGISPQNMKREQIESVIEEINALQGQQVKCDKCSTTLLEIRKNSQLGCADCYDKMGNSLEGDLRRFHKRSSHDCLPVIISEKQKRQRQITDLKKELQISISNENYEKAAILRDQIDSLSLL